MITPTPRSLELFLAYAADAANWGGVSPVGENVGGSREDNGSLTQLKRAGLIDTVKDGYDILVHFTAAGRALAARHGIEIPR
jgi:hypothetical protein